MHPSGFHLAADIVITSIAPIPFSTAQSIGEAGPIKVHSAVVFEPTRVEGEITGIYEDNNDDYGQFYAGPRNMGQSPYFQPGYYTDEEDDNDIARERLSVYKTPVAFDDSTMSTTIGHIIDNYNNIDDWAGFHLKLDDTFVTYSDSSYVTFDQTYHIQTVDSDGPVSLYNYYK